MTQLTDFRAVPLLPGQREYGMAVIVSGRPEMGLEPWARVSSDRLLLRNYEASKEFLERTTDAKLGEPKILAGDWARTNEDWEWFDEGECWAQQTPRWGLQMAWYCREVMQ